MNMWELAEHLAGRMGISRTATKEAVDGVFEVIGDALAKGEEARIVGFATLGTESRWARTARNPWTGKQPEIAAPTAPVFKVGTPHQSRARPTRSAYGCLPDAGKTCRPSHRRVHAGVCCPPRNRSVFGHGERQDFAALPPARQGQTL